MLYLLYSAHFIHILLEDIIWTLTRKNFPQSPSRQSHPPNASSHMRLGKRSDRWVFAFGFFYLCVCQAEETPKICTQRAAQKNHSGFCLRFFFVPVIFQMVTCVGPSKSHVLFWFFRAVGKSSRLRLASAQDSSHHQDHHIFLPEIQTVQPPFATGRTENRIGPHVGCYFQ